MNTIFRTSSFRAFLGVGGIFGLGILALRSAGATPVDVGDLAPVYAEPAERVEVRALGSGMTLGEVLAEALDAGEQNRLLMAFREQASPRRMRTGTEIMLRYQDGSAGAGEWLRGVDVALTPDETVRLTRSALGTSWRFG